MAKCKHPDCFYSRHGGSNGFKCCHYLLWTGEVRGCSAEQCDKYVPRNNAKKLGLVEGES